VVDWPARISFAATFVLATLPVWAYTLVTDACCCCARRSDEARRRRGRFVAWLVWLSWRLAFRVCCWVRLEREGLKAMGSAGTRGRQVFAVSNHVSWLDTPILCSLLPEHLVGDTKTLMARSHLGLPVLGRLAEAIGHLPVPFLSRSEGDFSIDKEAFAKTLERLNGHLDAGGHLMIFPEGGLNADWRTLQPFRAGGLEFCIRYDMEVWGWLVAGTANCWPSTVAVGGSPAVIRNQALLLYPSAKEAAERLAGAQADLKTQAVALAGDMRTKMQRCLDELVAGGPDGAGSAGGAAGAFMA